jgi:hypothetical protein
MRFGLFVFISLSKMGEGRENDITENKILESVRTFGHLSVLLR